MKRNGPPPKYPIPRDMAAAWEEALPGFDGVLEDRDAAILATCKAQREEIARLRGALAPIVALLESDGPITAKVWPGLYPLHQAARAALAEVEA